MTSSDRPLELGSLIANNYRVSQRLGAGGMGTVYLAENVTLQQRVVVKVLRGGAAGAGQEEAQMLANLQHPNVVTVFAHDPKLDCIVMEYLDGQSLGGLLEKGVDTVNAIRIGLAVADALAAVHRRGLVHRDIKPENVMLALNPGGGRLVDWLKLIDFGLALKAGKKPPVLLGTPEYCGPEQFRSDEPAHPGNDVYALGVTLFLMLTGIFPFNGEPDQLAELHENRPPPHLVDTLRSRPNAPKLDPRTLALLEDLDDLVQQMMAKQVAERPSAQEVARRLTRLESNFAEAGTYVGTAASPISTPDLQPVTPKKKNPTQLIGRRATDETRTHLDPARSTDDLKPIAAKPKPSRAPPARAREPVDEEALADVVRPSPVRWLIPLLAVVVLGLGAAVVLLPGGDSKPKDAPADVPPPVETPVVAKPPEPAPTVVDAGAEPSVDAGAPAPEPIAVQPPPDAGSDDEDLSPLTPTKGVKKGTPKSGNVGKPPPPPPAKKCTFDKNQARAEFQRLLRANPDVEDFDPELGRALSNDDCVAVNAILAKVRKLVAGTP